MRNKFELSHGGREKYTAIKYKKDYAGDCSIRALAHFLDEDYKHIRNDLFNLASKLWRMPNDDVVIGEYLTNRGFKRHTPVTNAIGRKYSIGQFPGQGTFLIRCSRHWTCLKNGYVLDTWDCRRLKAQSYYTFNEYDYIETHK